MKQQLNQSGRIVFRKWSRKNNAAFMTIGKHVMIATMTLALSIPFGVKTIQAQTDTTKFKESSDYELDEIVVSSDEIPVAFAKTARIVSVISRSEIESSPATDLNELLEHVLNIDIRQRGNHGVQADLSIRGGTFDQTLILLNGVSISDPQTGHHNLDIPLDLNSIYKIEVISGPAAKALGANAFTGAINIITKPLEKNHINTSLTGGMYGFIQGTTDLHLKTKKAIHFLSFSHKQSDGYLPNETLNNTDFNTSSVFYHGVQKAKDVTLELQSGFQTKAFGANSFYTPAYPEQFEATKTIFLNVQGDYKNDFFSVKPSIYTRRHYDRFELFRDTAPAWYASHNYHMTDIAGTNLNFTINPGFGYIGLNYKYQNAHIYSNVLGDSLENPISISGTDAEYIKEAERNVHTVHLSYGFDWKIVHFTAGVMSSWYSDLKNPNLSPGLELSLKAFNGLHLFTSYNEALRLPTFTDLYYNGPTKTGNPDLKPETSQTIEAGLKYLNTGLLFQASVFSRKGSDIIDWVKTSPDEILWHTENLTNVDATGFNANCKILLNSMLSIDKYGSIQFSYSYIDLKKEAGGYLSLYALDNLKHKFTAQINQDLLRRLNINIGLNYQERNGTYTSYDGNTPVEVGYSPIWLFDARLTYRKDKIKLFIEASNLLDKTYFDYGNVPQPGRWFRVGISFNTDI